MDECKICEGAGELTLFFRNSDGELEPTLTEPCYSCQIGGRFDDCEE